MSRYGLAVVCCAVGLILPAGAELRAQPAPPSAVPPPVQEEESELPPSQGEEVAEQVDENASVAPQLEEQQEQEAEETDTEVESDPKELSPAPAQTKHTPTPEPQPQPQPKPAAKVQTVAAGDKVIEGLTVGGDIGMATAFGPLGRELNMGTVLRAFAHGRLFQAPVGLELDLGLAIQSIAVERKAGSLLRVPLTASVLYHLPLHAWANVPEHWPQLYVRGGAAAAWASLGRGSKTRVSEGSIDLALHYGGGLELPLRSLDLPKWSARLDVRHIVQYERRDGRFLEVTLGLGWLVSWDQDGDGVEDDVDQCPTEREDPDGFEDEDGCPDPDNDNDTLLDDNDACPDRAEDLDGFKDDDGCPDDDNDSDGVADVNDACPMDAEDQDGFDDGDGCPDRDNDQDGIEDVKDKCPLEPEDVDTFQDFDGCPDPDNDGDGILDVNDKCPLQPEEMNGLRDDDGCPDAKDDRDKDTVVDKLDKCPTEPEDLDGFEDEDGCPDLDNDNDGVPDTQDACPQLAEDLDGFEDQDGCPDLDNDGDGIADEADQCPMEAEVVNGVDDADGCPDQGAQLVSLTDKNIEIDEKVHFATGSARILDRSDALLVQVVNLLQNHKGIRKIQVEGHTDDRGGEEYNQKLSERRAQSVVDYLVRRGIDPQRLEAVGYGETKPIASNKSRRGREMNRRVAFTIVEKIEAGEPIPASNNTPPPPPPPEAKGVTTDEAAPKTGEHQQSQGKLDEPSKGGEAKDQPKGAAPSPPPAPKK